MLLDTNFKNKQSNHDKQFCRAKSLTDLKKACPFEKNFEKRKNKPETLALRELLNKIKTKNKLFKQLHKKFDKDNFEKYKKQRNALNREIKSAKETYYKDLIDDSYGNSSSLWKILGELANL